MEKIIEDFENYIINDSGNNNETVWSTKSNKWLKPGLASNGYYTVALCKNGIRHTKTLHRLIAKAFIPNADSLEEIDHINTNRQDNRICNLRWTNRIGNCRNETTKQHLKMAQDHKKKPINQYDLEGKLVNTFSSIHEVEKKGYDRHNITNCCNGKRLTAYGYKWSFRT